MDIEIANSWRAIRLFPFLRTTNYEHRHGGIRYVSLVPAYLSASIAFRLCVPTHRALRTDCDSLSNDLRTVGALCGHPCDAGSRLLIQVE
jgi:hypothetical protein